VPGLSAGLVLLVPLAGLAVGLVEFAEQFGTVGLMDCTNRPGLAVGKLLELLSLQQLQLGHIEPEVAVRIVPGHIVLGPVVVVEAVGRIDKSLQQL